MGQINDRRYDIDDVVFGKKNENVKKGTLIIDVKIDSINLNDGLLLILLHDRPLFLAFEYDGKKPIKVGNVTLHHSNFEAAHATSTYYFEMDALDWQPSKFETNEWKDGKKMKMIVVDMAADPIIASEKQHEVNEAIEQSLSGDDIREGQDEDEETYQQTLL